MLKLESIPSEVRKETSKDKKLPACIPKPLPMAWIILGAVGAGKSSMLWSMINPKTGWFKGYFDKIVVWQSTIDSNSTWEKIPDCEVINEFDEDFLKGYYNQIQDQQQLLRDKRKRIHNYLFVFDDMITQGIVSHHRISVIDHIFQTYRHANVSIVICSQMYHQLNKTTRSLNLSALVVLKVNKKEIEEVAKEHSGLLSEEEFVNMYHKVMEEKRGYLFIDYKAGLRERFRDTINEVIQLSE
jgi:hypothetical protein